MSLSPNADLAIDRWPEVSQITGFRSKSHVENLEKLGLFPRSVKIGLRAKGWVHSEIIGWLEQRIADSRKDAFKGGS
jgi:prophage regulatory protein